MRGLVLMVVALAVVAGLMTRAPVLQSATPGPQALKPPELAVAQTSAPESTSGTTQFASSEGTLELQRAPDGHFYADVRINGSLVHMLVDTGASAIALSRDDARTAGLAPSIAMTEIVGEGANGAVHGEFAKLDRVELGPLSAEGLDAIVLNSGGQSLLGQNFLSRFASVQIEGDRMLLR